MLRLVARVYLVLGVATAGHAATEVPPVPDRAACEQMAKQAGGIDETYGGVGTYLGCLVAGSVRTLHRETARLIAEAHQRVEPLGPQTSPEDLLAACRAARARVRLAAFTVKYLRDFLYKESDEGQRDILCKLAGTYLAEAQTLDELVEAYHERLRIVAPEVHAAGLESQAATRGYCEMKYGRYRSGAMSEPQRNFLFPDLYSSTVVACAEQDFDYYQLLDKRAYRALMVSATTSSEKAMEALGVIKYHCHLPSDDGSH
ncbi:MAG: hypothetical protein R3F16_00870 [Myxococcota bacterium]